MDVRCFWQVPTFDSELAAHRCHHPQVAALSPTPSQAPYFTLNGAAASPVYGAQHTLTAPYQRTALPHVAGPGLGRDHDLRPLVPGPVDGNHGDFQFEAPSASPSTPPFNLSSIAEPCQREPKFATVGSRPLDSQGSHHNCECDPAGLRVQGNHDLDMCGGDCVGQSTLAAASFDVDLAHRLSGLFEPWEVVSDTPQWQPDRGVDSLGAASAADESELDPFWKDWKPWLLCVRSAA